MNDPLTMALRHFATARVHTGDMSLDLLLSATPEPCVPVDRAAFAEAVALIAHYGDHAGLEAAARADRSRSLGNVIHFCHWRQIQRTIAMLGEGDVTGTIH